MKQRVYNLIILDESGSMGCIQQEAINGVNETFQTILEAQENHDDQEHYVTFVSFNSTILADKPENITAQEVKKILASSNSRINIVYKNTPVKDVKKISANDYQPKGTTPLYDAMGISLTNLERIVGKEDVVLVTVITDGQENSSKDYSRSAIKSLVETLKGKGWIFTYIGANQDVEKVGASISINNTLSFSQSDEGTQVMFERERGCRGRLFDQLAEGHSTDELANNYFDGVEK